MLHLERVGEVRILEVVGNGAEHLEEEWLPVQDVQLLHQELQAGRHQAVCCQGERGRGFRDLFLSNLQNSSFRGLLFIEFTKLATGVAALVFHQIYKTNRSSKACFSANLQNKQQELQILFSANLQN